MKIQRKKKFEEKSAKNKSPQSDQVTQFSYRGGSSGFLSESEIGLPGGGSKFW